MLGFKQTWIIYFLIACISSVLSDDNRVGGNVLYTPTLPGYPWPLPQVWQAYEKEMTLNELHFEFIETHKGCQPLQRAFARYRSIIFPNSNRNVEHPLLRVLKGIQVSNITCEDVPYLGMNETYRLEISGDKIVYLDAFSIWGALRGLETFSQLVSIDSSGKYRVNHTRIEDWPRFQHRGIMLDTSRHYIPVSIIKKSLDAMVSNKLNVLHWHFSDRESFPFGSKKQPYLYQKAAYSQYHVYEINDVKKIVDMANARGIRVIPEFDASANVPTQWKYIKELHDFLAENCVETSMIPVAPSFRTFVEKIITELFTIFTDEYLHIGLDDGWQECWDKENTIQAFKSYNGVVLDGVALHYINVFKNILKKGNKKAIVWESSLQVGVRKIPDDITIQFMKHDSKKMISEMDSTNKFIISDCWNLKGNEEYSDILDFRCKSLEKNTDPQLIGGEVLIWTKVIDGSNIFNKLWPRASVAAEQLWGSKISTDTEFVMKRLNQHRCAMMRREIPVAPLGPGYCPGFAFEGWVNKCSRIGPSPEGITAAFYIFFMCVVDYIKDVYLMQETLNSNVILVQDFNSTGLNSTTTNSTGIYNSTLSANSTQLNATDCDCD